MQHLFDNYVQYCSFHNMFSLIEENKRGDLLFCFVFLIWSLFFKLIYICTFDRTYITLCDIYNLLF